MVNNEIIIQNMDQTVWFKTLDNYPKNIESIKLLVSIVDKIGIMDRYDILLVASMDSDRLDILYVVLRIMYKIFDLYLNCVVKKIFIDNLKEIFKYSHITYHDLFFDQLMQDIDHFVCYVVKMYYPEIKRDVIVAEFVEYLKLTFKKSFYQISIKKLSYNIGDNFFEKNQKSFISIIEDFLKYTSVTLSDTYSTMKIFLDKIFNMDCPMNEIVGIKSVLDKYFDVEKILKEGMMEFDIYSEQKFSDENY
ncbi:MAG: putative ORFan [Satyrvirus sp.]|uniref:Putative ORFan n=1 Tax=Satyrvirus sp. TaxID=2487771 RepID=A0A3G5ADY3_9VIRU|nr:MAG: putative ORFan [Satyrvirus sp.]